MNVKRHNGPHYCRRVGLVLAFCLALDRGAAGADATNTAPPVTAVQSGTDVVLDNGIVTATIQPSPIGLASLRYQGHELVSQQGRHKFIYLSLNGDRDYEMLSGGVFSVQQCTPDMADISCKRLYSPASRGYPCDVGVHFVLRRGLSGLYVYVTVGHPASYPELNASVWRMVWSMPQEQGRWLMEKIYVDRLRHWEIPSPLDFARSEATGIKEIVKLTTGAWRGQYDCKYMYSASYWDLGCWGFASDRSRIGAWYVLGSAEFLNDGPTHADLNAESGVLEILFNQIHYNGSSIRVPRGEAWQKIYGPYLLYCNASPAGGDACWADAQRRVQVEQAAWPYAWLTNSLYPLKAERGAVAGRLAVADALKPATGRAGAWVGLAQLPPGGNWQFDSHRYQYWVKSDADGRFFIPNVRPGAFTLYAFTTGAVGEFSRTNIAVQRSATNDLGTVTWCVPHPGSRIAWEIGVPDRTAGEFRHGNDYFRPYMWQKFSAELPNPLEYTVGVSDWSKDWNYVHCGYLRDGAWSPWKWRIHFTLANPPAAGDATLTLAYASSYYGRTEIYVNDEDKMFALVRPAVDGGNALIREGIHAKYCVERVPIAMSRLRPGTNTITLVQGQNRFDRPFFHVMYDYVSLELPRAAP
jgi:rhamnogalacturonan endolyase